MPATSMIITADKSEYSKYDFSCKVINITATCVAGTIVSGETYAFSVKRLPSENWPEQYSAIMSRQVTASSQDALTSTISCSFTVGVDDLDATFIPRAIHGKYRVEVSYGVLVWTTPSPIAISILTSREIRSDWCFGMTLKAMEILSLKFQPRMITGLTVNEISSMVIPGIKTLTLVYTAPVAPVVTPVWTLAWDQGTPAIITTLEKQQVLLLDETNINYVLADVTPTLLPRAGVVENVLVAEQSMSDDLIQTRISYAINSAESLLGFALEPYIITTLPRRQSQRIEKRAQQDFWDRIGRPVDFIPQVDVSQWPTFRLPHQWCNRLDSLYGYHSTDKIVNVSSDWYESTIDRMTGLVTLVPSINSFTMWQVYTHPMLAPFYTRYAIPAFWQYTGTFGLPDMFGEGRALVRELIARIAAISILTEAGRAYQGGIGGESTSRDGLSSSRQFNAGGPYASTIQAHQQWVEKEAPRIKTKLGGLLMQMIGA